MRNKILTAFVLLTAPLLLKAQTDSVPNVTQLLGLSLEQLMNIQVVTSAGFLQTTTEAPSTIEVITASHIRERGYLQLEDALRDIPGIDMIHLNGYAPTLFYFRGMYGAENLRALLMIDGIAENNILGSNDMAGPAYSLHNVERIEIIWGPASALYGANAFGGVINIITKKGANINGLRAERGFGSFNTSVGNIMLGLKKSNFEISISGSTYSTDGPKFTSRDPNYSGSYVDKAYSFNSLLSYYTQKSKTTLGYREYKTPMGWGTYSNSPNVYLGLPPQGNSNIGVIGVLSRDIRGEKSGLDDSYLRTLFIEHVFKASEKLNFLGRLTYRETGIDDDSYLYITVDGRKLIRAKIASSSNRVTGEFSTNYSPTQKQRFSAGIQLSQDNVEQGARQATFDPTVHLIDGKDTVINLASTFLPRQYDIRSNFGSYLQYALNTNLLRKTNFTFGVRYDYNSYFQDAISPRLVIVNQPTDKLTFKVQFGTAFRAPTNLEIHQSGLNFQLTTEKIKTYEVNAIYTPSKYTRLQLNAFRNELTDVIILANLSGPIADKNPGEITAKGIELSLNMDVAKNLYGFANFTYQDVTGINLITGATGDVAAVAKMKGNIGLTYHTDLLTFNLTGNWVGSRPVQKTNPYGPVAGYFLTNFNIATQPLFNDRITASIGIHNLFNTKWLDPGFRTADGSLYSTVLEQPGISGMFRVSISLNNH